MIKQEQVYEILENYLPFVKKAFKLTYDLNVEFDTEGSVDGKINARITRKKDVLLVTFTDYFIENIANSIDYKYFADLDEETASNCSSGFSSFLFRCFDGTTCLIEFKNLIAYFIVLNIFNHEISHYLLGHLDEDNKSFAENEEDSEERGITSLVKEYAADTIGTLLTIHYIFIKNFSELTDFDIKDDKFTSYCVRQLFVTFLSAIYVQYDLLSQFSDNKNSMWEINKRSHPHIFVRMINSIHLLSEFIIDRINEANNLTDDESSFVLSFFVDEQVKAMNPFFKSNFKLSLSKVNFSKEAWEQRFAIIDYACEKGLCSEPKFTFNGFCKYSEEEKRKILDKCS